MLSTREFQLRTVSNRGPLNFNDPQNKWDTTKLLMSFSIYDHSTTCRDAINFELHS